ncbi:preprotein translocase subunit SecY [Candidatus Peregrinibacteria bacterium]|nr:MAG: preprotein translocase subunit SecY [Candidatus Peregrinibacteria bacterium]
MNYLAQIWKTKDLRNKILFTIGMLAIFRFVAHIPLPGVDLEAIKEIFAQNKVLGVFSALTGGSMNNVSIALMGLAPYINASIIIQLMTVVIPHLEQLSEEGEEGRKTINSYTRWLTLPLAFIQSYGMILLLSRGAQGAQIIDTGNWEIMLPAMLTLTAGTVFVMWLGEVISEKGIGNGSSLIIFAGIVAGIPQIFGNILGLAEYDSTKLGAFIGFSVFTIFLLVIITLFTEAIRNIPITYATRGNRAQKSSMPLRLNQSGMIPIIFAMSMITFPAIMAQFMQSSTSQTLVNLSQWISQNLSAQNPSYVYMIIYFLLVWSFSFFYVSIVFKPQQMAENIQKRGGYIVGIRPGEETAKYLEKSGYYLTFWGGLFLAAIAIIPLVFTKFTTLEPADMILSGSGLIIVVGVVLELIRQINAHLVAHDYDKI